MLLFAKLTESFYVPTNINDGKVTRSVFWIRVGVGYVVGTGITSLTLLNNPVWLRPGVSHLPTESPGPPLPMVIQLVDAALAPAQGVQW